MIDTMNILLAEATKAAETFAGLSVPSWILLLTTLGGGGVALLKWIDARASKREAHEERLARITAERERDVMIEGVDLGADGVTKAAIRKTALARGVPTLAESVKAATRRLGGPAALFLACLLLTGLAGCCAVDHDRMAATASDRFDLLGAALALPEAELAPIARDVIQSDRDYVESVYSELTGAPITSSTRARIESNR